MPTNRGADCGAVDLPKKAQGVVIGSPPLPLPPPPPTPFRPSGTPPSPVHTFFRRDFRTAPCTARGGMLMMPWHFTCARGARGAQGGGVVLLYGRAGCAHVDRWRRGWGCAPSTDRGQSQLEQEGALSHTRRTRKHRQLGPEAATSCTHEGKACMRQRRPLAEGRMLSEGWQQAAGVCVQARPRR